mmetsp:Transcript_32388/g.48868  ORF Transcript_32388/g.48868 Transcript_32388/m.48868 type:complete len:215 (+) Transcript_32388:397-1041(+)
MATGNIAIFLSLDVCLESALDAAASQGARDQHGPIRRHSCDDAVDTCGLGCPDDILLQPLWSETVDSERPAGRCCWVGLVGFHHHTSPTRGQPLNDRSRHQFLRSWTAEYAGGHCNRPYQIQSLCAWQCSGECCICHRSCHRWLACSKLWSTGDILDDWCRHGCSEHPKPVRAHRNLEVPCQLFQHRGWQEETSLGAHQVLSVRVVWHLEALCH